MKRYARVAAALAAATGALCAAADAEAADCNFGGQNVVYVTGSSASGPYLAAASQVLAAQATPVTLVYIQTESCQGVTDMVAGTALTSVATYWTAGDGGPVVTNTCNFSATSTPTSAVPDASVSDVYASTCPSVTVPATQAEVAGPVQAMTFIVHPNSTESSISAEAAHVIYKDIATAAQQISPWTDAAQLYTRQGGPAGSGTRAMISAAIGFTADSDWSSTIPSGNVFTGSGALLAAVAGNSANANKTLGILTVQKTDANRPGAPAPATPVKVLAFQAKGQKCGYLPDSTAQSFDKLNVREGRYDIWGPLHFITAVKNGQPASSSNPGAGDAWVQSFVNLVTLPTGSVLTDAQKMSMIAASAKAHVVAQCAMRVKRTAEVGPEASFVPPESCGCYWESVATGAAPTACKACSASTDCASTAATPTCRYGFCEAQ